MITLLEIADLLVNLLEIDEVYAGCTDASKEKVIGVYYRDMQTPRTCTGGKSSYQTAKLRILVHWTDNPSEAESISHKIEEILLELNNADTEKHIVKFADVKGIRSIGKDEKGISEFIIDTDFIYTERI